MKVILDPHDVITIFSILIMHNCLNDKHDLKQMFKITHSLPGNTLKNVEKNAFWT